MNKYDVKRTCGEGSFAVSTGGAQVYGVRRGEEDQDAAAVVAGAPAPASSAASRRWARTARRRAPRARAREEAAALRLRNPRLQPLRVSVGVVVAAAAGARRQMLAQLLSGVGHIHAHGFMHRDLKPENVLCDAAATHLKVADLGLARELRSRPPYTDYIHAVVPRARERARRGMARVDVWALGCIGAELLTRKPHCPARATPTCGARWSRCSARSTAAGTRAPRSRAAGCGRPRAARRRCQPLPPGDGANLVRDLLAWNPRRRPTCRTALGHPFVKATPPLAATFNARGSSSTASAVAAAPPPSPPRRSRASRAPPPRSRRRSREEADAAARVEPSEAAPPESSPPPTASGRGRSPPAARRVARRASRRPGRSCARRGGSLTRPIRRARCVGGQLLSHLGLLHHHCKQTASARGCASTRRSRNGSARRPRRQRHDRMERAEDVVVCRGEAAGGRRRRRQRPVEQRPAGGGGAAAASGGGTLDERLAARSGGTNSGANGGSGDAAWEAEKALLREIFSRTTSMVTARSARELTLSSQAGGCGAGGEEMDEMSKRRRLRWTS